MGCAAQVSGVAHLVGVQRTVQENGNVKSKAKYLACEEPPICAFYFWLDSLLFFCRSIGFYSGLTYLLSSYSQTGQPSATFSTRLWTWLCKYVCCEGPAALSPCPAPGVSANWNSERDLKLTFLSVTDTYVHTYIARIDPSFKVSR